MLNFKSYPMRSIRVFSCLIGFILIGSIATLDVSAEMSVSDKNKLLGASPKEWESSSLREWLNSEEQIVSYTANPPVYADEAGFLSPENFTTEEVAGIAVTRHGSAWQYSIGNRNNTKYWSDRQVAHNDHIHNDKVFLLNYTDLVHYIERNGQLANLSTKQYSPKLQSETNLLDKYEYAVNSGYYNGTYYGTNELYGSRLGTFRYTEDKRVVPALSLKPDFILKDGQKASELKIGSIVEFGSYDGEPITWQVLNQSIQGYPLLQSVHILTVKNYDAQGDLNPFTSNYINFPTADVDITQANGQGRTWETEKLISATPVISILNESVLSTPTNEEEITIEIQATDAQSGIRKITLPDGTVVDGDRASFVMKSNGEYTILAESNEGVVSSRHIITKAINTPAEVLITTNQSSGSKWTNKPVQVSVSASNNGVYEKTIPGGLKKFGSHTTSSFPSWMALGDKRVQVTGSISCAMTPAEQAAVDMNAVIRLRSNMNVYTIWNIGPSYPIIFETTFKELCQQGSIDFTRIWNFPSNAYNSINYSISIMDGNSNYNKPEYKYETSEIHLSVLDRDDLKIERITLPDGTIVNGDTATYTAFETGVYHFSVMDNRGKVTEKSIELAIDTDVPEATVVQDTALTNQNVVLSIMGTDSLSGIREIKLPNGESRVNTEDGKGLAIDYTITQNGSYTFEIIDFAGNVTKRTVTVTNIDKSAPVIEVQKTPNVPTSGKVVVSLLATDVGTGLESLTLPNGRVVPGPSASFEVYSNGAYSVSAKDKVGNQTDLIVVVDNIDGLAPNVLILPDLESEWANQDVEIQIFATDN